MIFKLKAEQDEKQISSTKSRPEDTSVKAHSLALSHLRLSHAFMGTEAISAARVFHCEEQEKMQMPLTLGNVEMLVLKLLQYYTAAGFGHTAQRKAAVGLPSALM